MRHFHPQQKFTLSDCGKQSLSRLVAFPGMLFVRWWHW